MSIINPAALAAELTAAYADRDTRVVPPSSRDSGFDLATAYAVEAELVRLRAARGHRPVGRKVGYANKAAWRVLKLETLVWARMYDDTVRDAAGNTTTLPVSGLCAPKIEPEIVFKLRAPLAGTPDAAGALAAVEWLALGFEIIDCVYADWKFQPADFVASFGLHAALVVGTPLVLEPGSVPGLVDALPQFTVKLSKDGRLVAEGSGRNSLRSPALALAELATAVSRQAGAGPLAAGELVSSGTLTESQAITAGETWSAEVAGLSLPPLTLRTVE
jgi:2-oxo-3-hexenedioate decarboxylase